MKRRQIFKYTLDKAKEFQTVEIPEKSLLMSTQNQNENLVIWAAVFPDHDIEYMEFQIVLTGQKEPKHEDWRYMKTVLFDNGNYVVHIYQKRYTHIL